MDTYEGKNIHGDARILAKLDETGGVPFGDKTFDGIFGEQLVVSRNPQFMANFSYPLSTKSVNGTIVNSGVVDRNVNLLRVSTGIVTGSNALIRSKRSLRYTAGRDAEAMFTAIFTAGVADTYQRIGLFDDNNGFYVGMEGIDFIVGRRKSGEADEIITQANFNGDKLDGTGLSGMIYDPTMINIFRITYGYLGTAPILYQISTNVGGVIKWVTFHVIDRRNLFNTTSITVPYLQLSMQVDNGSTTSNMRVETASIYAGTYGETLEDKAARVFAAEIPETSITGVNQRIAIFHNKTTFQGIDNHIESDLLYFTGAVEGNKPAKIELYKLENQVHNGVWADVDTDNSTFEYSFDAVITDLANSDLVVSFSLGKSESMRERVEGLGINLLPDEYMGILVSSTSLTDVIASFRWNEKF